MVEKKMEEGGNGLLCKGFGVWWGASPSIFSCRNPTEAAGSRDWLGEATLRFGGVWSARNLDDDGDKPTWKKEANATTWRRRGVKLKVNVGESQDGEAGSRLSLRFFMLWWVAQQDDWPADQKTGRWIGDWLFGARYLVTLLFSGFPNCKTTSSYGVIHLLIRP